MEAVRVSVLAPSLKCVSTSWFGRKNQELFTEIRIKPAVISLWKTRTLNCYHNIY
jgi:hypothetical protein